MIPESFTELMQRRRAEAAAAHPGAPICDGCLFPVPRCRGYGDCPDHDLLAERDELVALATRLEAREAVALAERDRYRLALERIAGEDYRGNRPQSATIAWQALNPEGATS